jgi:MATE family multidrug resistance protein
MKILMIFSYFTDGFAYAGEALTGRHIGSQDRSMVRQTVKWTFIWSMSIAVMFMGIYHFGGVPLVRLMTSDVAVVEQSKVYLPWLLLMPVVGCAAFTWDGIYIGATASKAIRDSMIWAVAAFGLTWIAGQAVLNLTRPERYDVLAMHVLMAAYFAHLLARTVYLSVRYRKTVLDQPFNVHP